MNSPARETLRLRVDQDGLEASWLPPHRRLRKLNLQASTAPKAQEALDALQARYGSCPPEEADTVVALGGDGFMLEVGRRLLGSGIPVFGMNRGSVGFLMNNYTEVGLLERIATAVPTRLRPLRMVARDRTGTMSEAFAFNEVSLLRETHQASKLRIFVNGAERLTELISDGVLVATPAGSTAYNLSAHGPIVPINSSLLALTPVSAFRPRRWRGALLPSSARIRFEVLEAAKRPVSSVADAEEVRDVVEVEVAQDPHAELMLLFDVEHDLEERILREQFTD